MQDLIDHLNFRMSHPLPGKEAHQRMAPTLSSGSPIRFRNTTDPHHGAVLILLYPHQGKVFFPLIQRPVYDGVHSDQVSLPGGRYEQHDNDLLTTALRETREEIGVPEEKVKIIGELSKFMVSASNHMVLPVVGYVDEKPEFIPEPKEVAHVIEGGIDELLDEQMMKSKEIITRQGHRLNSPYFELGGKVVWGATAMMLSEFVSIIKS